MTTNANWIHKFDHATGALRNIAEILAAFRRSRIDSKHLAALMSGLTREPC